MASSVLCISKAFDYIWGLKLFYTSRPSKSLLRATADGSVSRQIPAGQTPQPGINWRPQQQEITGETGLHEAVLTPRTRTHAEPGKGAQEVEDRQWMWRRCWVEKVISNALEQHQDNYSPKKKYFRFSKRSIKILEIPNPVRQCL